MHAFAEHHPALLLPHAESAVLANLAVSYPRPMSAFSVARDGLKHFQLNQRQSFQGMDLLIGHGLARVRHNHLMLTARGEAFLGDTINQLACMR